MKVSYKCDVCDVFFRTEKHLLLHSSRAHKNVGTYSSKPGTKKAPKKVKTQTASPKPNALLKKTVVSEAQSIPISNSLHNRGNRTRKAKTVELSKLTPASPKPAPLSSRAIITVDSGKLTVAPIDVDSSPIVCQVAKDFSKENEQYKRANLANLPAKLQKFLESLDHNTPLPGVDSTQSSLEYSGPELKHNLVCAECLQIYVSTYLFHKHVANAHCNVEGMFFPTMEVFESWMSNMEKVTGAEYEISKFSFHKKYFNRCKYVMTYGEYALLCPSYVAVTVFATGVQAHFYKNHCSYCKTKEYIIPEEFRQYVITSLPTKTTVCETKTQRKQYLQYKTVMENIIKKAEAAEVEVLQILLWKARDMNHILNDANPRNPRNKSSLTDKEVSVVLESPPSPKVICDPVLTPAKPAIQKTLRDTPKSTPTDQELIMHDHPKIINTYSLAEIKTELENFADSETDSVEESVVDTIKMENDTITMDDDTITVVDINKITGSKSAEQVTEHNSISATDVANESVDRPASLARVTRSSNRLPSVAAIIENSISNDIKYKSTHKNKTPKVPKSSGVKELLTPIDTALHKDVEQQESTLPTIMSKPKFTAFDKLTSFGDSYRDFVEKKFKLSLDKETSNKPSPVVHEKAVVRSSKVNIEKELKRAAHSPKANIEQNSTRAVVHSPKVNIEKDPKRAVVHCPRVNIEEVSKKARVRSPKVTIEKDSKRRVVHSPKANIEQDSSRDSPKGNIEKDPKRAVVHRPRVNTEEASKKAVVHSPNITEKVSKKSVVHSPNVNTEQDSKKSETKIDPKKHRQKSLDRANSGPSAKKIKRGLTKNGQKPAFKTKIGQFVPSPKKPAAVKPAPRRSSISNIILEKYEVKEQENDCNILILKL